MRRGDRIAGLPSATVAAICLIARAAGAISGDLRGYVKDYPATWRQRNGPIAGSVARAWYNSTRGRVASRLMAGRHLTLAADYDGRLVFATGADTAFGLIPAAGGTGFVDLTRTPINEEHAQLVQTLDRLYAQWYSRRVVATVGRQRIAWGVATWFSPLDRFAPFAPAEIDKEEKAGVDAADLSIPLGALSNVEAVWSGQRRTGLPGIAAGGILQNLGARFRTTRGAWDITLVGGWFAGADAAGGSLAGSIGGIGIHGEALASHGGVRRTLIEARPGPDDTLRLREVRGDFVRATVGADYGFGWHNLTVAGEAYHDGSGAADKSRYDWTGLATGRRVGLARWYAALSASLQVTPLFTVTLPVLANLDEPALLVMPMAEYSVGENLDVRAGIDLSTGGAGSEYGAVKELYYAIIAWYF